MNNDKPKAWFWIVAVLAVTWNLVGVGAYLSEVTMSEEAVAALPEAQRSLHEAMPSWVVGAYAIAVFGGLAAAVALLLRRGFATPLFAVSLAAVVLQMGYVFIGLNAAAVLGMGATILPATIVVIAALLLVFSIHTRKRGWLR